MDTITGKTESILVIEAPPRHGKSEYVSKYLTSWYLGRWPDRRVILTSYEANFARSWGRKSRDVLREVGGELFGIRVSEEQHAAVDWEIEAHGGGMVTSGVGGPLTGRGANLLIIDDPIKNAEEAVSQVYRDKQWDWWQSTADTRLEPGAVVVVIATRWHPDDLSGRLLAASASGEGSRVRRIHLPAVAEANDELGRSEGEPLWPERFDSAALEKKKRGRDLYWWLSMYQQRPSRHTDSAWPDSYFDDALWSSTWPERFESSAIAIDPSRGRARGDYSAIVFCGLAHGKLWVWSDIRRRPEEQIVTDGIEANEMFRPMSFGVESNSFQSLLEPLFAHECERRGVIMPPLDLIHNGESKEEIRIRRLGPYLRSGTLRFDAGCPSNQILVQQLKEFPLGDHDDGPDALEMSIRLLNHLCAGATA